MEVKLQSRRQQMELEFATVARDAISSNAPRPPLGFTKPHIQMVMGGSSSGDKRAGA
jgi:hypothetical protein